MVAYAGLARPWSVARLDAVNRVRFHPVHPLGLRLEREENRAESNRQGLALFFGYQDHNICHKAQALSSRPAS